MPASAEPNIAHDTAKEKRQRIHRADKGEQIGGGAGGLEDAGLRPVADDRDIRRNSQCVRNLERAPRHIQGWTGIEDALGLNVGNCVQDGASRIELAGSIGPVRATGAEIRVRDVNPRQLARRILRGDRAGDVAAAQGKIGRGQLIGVVLGGSLVLGGRIRVQRQWTAHRSSGQRQPRSAQRRKGALHISLRNPLHRSYRGGFSCARTAAMVADEVEGTTQYSWFTVPSLR